MSYNNITMTGIVDTFSNPQDLPQHSISSVTHNIERQQIHIVREQKPLHQFNSKQKGIKHKEVSLEQLYNINKDLEPLNLKFYKDLRNLRSFNSFRNHIYPKACGT